MRACIPLSTHIILLHWTHVLLIQKGYNDTSWPGHWGLPAWKVENDELFRESSIRELEEETGVTVDVTDIEHELILNIRANNGTRVYYFWVSTNWIWTPENKELDKHNDMGWFPLDSLPDLIIPHVRYALEAVQAGKTYAEHDFTQIDEE